MFHIRTNKIIEMERAQHQTSNLFFSFLSFFRLRVPLAAGGVETNLFLSAPSVKLRPERKYRSSFRRRKFAFSMCDVNSSKFSTRQYYTVAT